MSTAPVKSGATAPPVSSVPVGARLARALSGLYFLRTGVSLVWVVTVAALSRSLGDSSSAGALVVVVLVLYPTVDAAATLVDLRVTPPGLPRLFQRANVVTSLVIAAFLLGFAHRGSDAILDIFGWWAIVSGAIQLTVGLQRHILLAGQWLMVVSGAGSIFAGTTFLGWSGSAQDGLALLVQYSVGGAVWYAVAAVMLAVAARRATASA